MSLLRRVEASRAGANALGVLLPPGRPTVLILRPRALPWDLLLVRSGESAQKGTPFLHLDREDATTMTEGLLRALERWRRGGPGRVDPAFAADGQGYWVQALVGSFPLLVCERRPGQPYRPTTFATPEEAQAAARAATQALCPEGDDEQEVYVNTRHFGK